MNMINKEPERHEIEALLPWHAAGTLNRRDADRVEQALAGDRELARRYDLVREELAETIHLNETLGAPSARAMEKLFAAIDVEEARSPRRKRSLDLGTRISEFLGGFAPRTLAWSAAAAAVAILLQAHRCRGQGPGQRGLHRRQCPAGQVLRGDTVYAAGDRLRDQQLPRCLQGHRGRGTDEGHGRQPLSHPPVRHQALERGGRQDHPGDARRIEDRGFHRRGAAAVAMRSQAQQSNNIARNRHDQRPGQPLPEPSRNPVID